MEVGTGNIDRSRAKRAGARGAAGSGGGGGGGGSSGGGGGGSSSLTSKYASGGLGPTERPLPAAGDGVLQTLRRRLPSDAHTQRLRPEPRGLFRRGCLELRRLACTGHELEPLIEKKLQPAASRRPPLVIVFILLVTNSIIVIRQHRKL